MVWWGRGSLGAGSGGGGEGEATGKTFRFKMHSYIKYHKGYPKLGNNCGKKENENY